MKESTKDNAKGRMHQTKGKLRSWEELRAAEKISISQGSLVCANETSGGKIEIDDLDLSIQNFSSGKTESLNPFKNISFTADAECKILRIYDFILMNFVMSATGEKGNTLLNNKL